MKRGMLILLVSFSLVNVPLLCQTLDTLVLDEVMNMSLEDILKVKVRVSSTVPTSLFESPSVVTVVDRQTIIQYNFTSVAEALRIVSGVEILQTVLDRNVPTIRGILQNFYANKVLIMINNIPVWQPTYGNGALDRISINDVERIEVLKGPASVLYGTNAYNGVINIVTINPELTTVTGEVSGGYPDYGAAALNYTYHKNDVTIQISGSSLYEDRNPYLLRMGADTLKIEETIYHGNDTIFHETYIHENDTLFYYKENYRNYTFNFKLKYRNHQFYLNNFANTYNHPGSSATYKSGANHPLRDKGTLLSYTYDKDFNNKTHIRFNTHFDYFFRDYQISHVDPESTEFSSYRVGSSIKLNHKFSQSLNLEAGGEFTNGHNLGHYIKAVIPDTVVSENIQNEKDIIESSLFLQGNLNLKKISLLAGSRLTYNQSFGSNISSRFTGLYRLNKNNSIKVLFGQSFRTPNLLELYFSHSSVVGNPKLEPEQATTYELIYLSRIKSLFAQVTGYYTQYTNLIQRIRTSTDLDEPATYRNLGSFDGYGLEMELKYQNPRIINCFVNYNYMQGKGSEAESNFKYVPDHYLSAGINKSFKGFFVSTNTYIYSSTEGTWDNIPSQHTIDVHFGYKHSIERGGNIIHTLSAKNINDSDMLIPEYIRNRPGVNVLPTSGFGRRIIYTLKLSL